MLRHAIAPSRRYTKASHDVVRHPRLTSDAKILLLAVQGLPEEAAARPLGEHARKLGITGRAYQRSKEQLVAHGYVHEWRDQGERGRWVTEQLLSNVPLTPEEASVLRHGRTEEPPGARKPTVGGPVGRVTGRQLPVEEEREKNSPHPPSEAGPEILCGAGLQDAGLQDALGPEAAEGERVLLSLRHVRRELYLGAKEARGLAELAGRWLLRGVSAGGLRRALTTELPGGGVRSAVGFLRFRLLHKMPPELPAAPSPEPAAAPPRVAELVACTAAGPEDDVHVFRPLSDETECGPCRRRAAWERWEQRKHLVEAEPEPLPWRERFAKLGASRAGGEGAVHRA
ncbi:hypothetical protein ABZ601_05600 [Streptomyces sp. NPDC012842]|uniref:hypothetical protein n=1 Tax=Streptomyces TaxID=1883 RepID=UPI0025B52B07|nr:hypothetical protein [Streptomyces sp. P9-2B-1]WJY32934.1 hypothetical protein QTO28_18875 [Streptomyces sp. P9-2B-1]